MTQQAKKITDIYQKEIDNLKWHIKNNGSYFTQNEVASIQLRIQDREEFIRYLSTL